MNWLAKTRQHLKLTETPCMDDRQVTPQCFNVAGELAPVCAQQVLKCLYLTRTGRTDLTVDRKNMLARSVTQKNTACGQRSARLLSFTNHSKHYRPYGFVGNTIKDLQTDFFQDASFARDLQDSKFKVRWSVMSIGFRKTLVPIS